ncbi:natural cytotoxicity triggering receptor 3-like isoform X2 [Huso huso]|uniref:Natural cytotoxicity triggering receptor 3 n=1 Tax=Huso huso TaxID=61971 RepID=A0ABR0YC88_HUSHU
MGFIIILLSWVAAAYISVVFAEELQVYQEPEVNATAGDRTRLGCAFNTSSGQVGTGSFKWYRVRSDGKRSEVSNETHRAGVVTSHEFRTNKDASLYLLHPHTYDSGVYYCEVELLSAGRRTGNGTVLAVYPRSKENQDSRSSAHGFDPALVPWIVRLSCLFVFFAVVSLCLFQAKQVERLHEMQKELAKAHRSRRHRRSPH